MDGETYFVILFNYNKFEIIQEGKSHLLNSRFYDQLSVRNVEFWGTE